MNRYLNELRKRIKKKLPKEECNDVMEYYTEYFADAGFNNEDEIVKEFGTVEELAGKIIEEYEGKQQNGKVYSSAKKGLSLGWVIFIAIIGSPLWLALFCVAFSLLFAVFIVVVTFGATGIGLGVGAIAIIISGIGLLISDIALGIYMIGCGCLICATGLGLIVLMMLIVQLVSKFFKFIKNKRKEKKTETIV